MTALLIFINRYPISSYRFLIIRDIDGILKYTSTLLNYFP